jgi:hypothetical protein
MEEVYEAVYEVVDDYHGPRSGLADFRGKPHWFCALGWVPTPEEGEAKWSPSEFDPREDRYALFPVTGSNGGRVFATGTFRPQQTASDSTNQLEVSWKPYGCLIVT